MAHSRGLHRSVLLVLALLCTLQAFFAFQLGRWWLVQAVSVALAAGMLVALRLRPRIAVKVAVTATSIFLVVAATELVLAALYRAPSSVTPNEAFDPRTRREVVLDLRSEGHEVYGLDRLPQSVPPLIWEDGTPAALLTDVPSVRMVRCKESGAYTVDRHDEFGFRNSPGLWNQVQISIAAVGDSFTEGACVAMDQTVAAHLRTHFPGTISLARGGNGPLRELATIIEYAKPLRPKIVLWSYHDNDVFDLSAEKRNPTLMRYLEPGFTQDLYAKREQISRYLLQVLEAAEREATPAWPTSLNALGFTRESAPLWFQDLVTGSDFTTVARVIRFDGLNQRIAGLRNYSRQEPFDFNLLAEILRRASEEVEAWEGRLYLVHLPSWSVLKFPQHRLRSVKDKVFAIAQPRIPVIDVSDRMLAHGDIDDLFFYPHSHYNEKGNAVAASAIVDGLKALEGPVVPAPQLD